MSNCLLSASQFGYRENKNTELATLHLIDNILPAFEIGSYCICVFLDFSACCDTISTGINDFTDVRYALIFESIPVACFPGLTLYGPNSFFRCYSGHNLR